MDIWTICENKYRMLSQSGVKRENYADDKTYQLESQFCDQMRCYYIADTNERYGIGLSLRYKNKNVYRAKAIEIQKTILNSLADDLERQLIQSHNNDDCVEDN